MVPAIEEFNTTLVTPPLHIVALAVEPNGFGLTVTSTVNVVPTHPVGAVAVTVYLTTPATVLLGLVRVCAIAVPHPEVHPPKPVTVPESREAV